MAQYEDRSTHTTTTPAREGTSGGTIAFIVGGLVVAVGIIAWFMFGGDIDTAPSATSSESSVTIETPEGGAAMEVAPADDNTSGSATVNTDDGSASVAVEEPAN